MAEKPTVIAVQVCIDDIMKEFGRENFETAMQIAKTLRSYLQTTRNFSGTIVFNVNCRNNGIGNVNAFVQNKLTNS